MLVVIAPHSLAHGSHNQNLAATRKINFFLMILARLHDRILLVNTLHVDKVWRKREAHVSRLGDSVITEIVLRTYPNRSLGKLLNLFEVGSVANEIGQHGRPTVVWVYNPYAFESLLARALKRRFNTSLIFEFEDWVRSRRKWHPKTLADTLAWRYLLPAPDLCLAVNQLLLEREQRRSGCHAVLCPGVVTNPLVEACLKRPAFSDPDSQKIVIGYFGTLTGEKGCHIILDLIKSTSGKFLFHISGRGPLASEFERLQGDYDHLIYHGHVAEETMYDLMAKCDVLLNLHKPIEEMGGGVFPFKVIEYIAAGRLVISTNLPEADIATAVAALDIVDYDSGSVLAALSSARMTYRDKRARIELAAADVRQRFGEDGLLKSISATFSPLSREADAPNLETFTATMPE